MKEHESNNEFSKNMKKMLLNNEMEEQMLKHREIFIWGPIDDDSAKSIVQKILYFNSLETKDIKLYINSVGGIISSGLAVYDAMQYSKSDMQCICMGQAASMAAVLLCAGAKGKRYAWENARVMIHQPLISGNVVGPASDLQIQAEEMIRIRHNLNGIIAKHTGQPIKKIDEDTDRDYFMSSKEAKEYGIIDHITQA